MSGAARIDIAFRGYWLGGTGSSGAGDADVFAYRDRHGCPAMPATQVKGILRETAERLWGANDSRVISLFGTGDSGGDAQGALRFAGDASHADAAAYASRPELRAAMFTILRSTQLEKGVATRKTLRGVEVALPLTISLTVDHFGADGNEWLDALTQICAATITMGKESHRGLGLAIVSCKEAPARAPAAVAAPQNHRLTLHLSCDHPAVFSQSGATEGQHRTLPGPPGSAIWGWAIENCKDRPELFAALLSGNIIFSDAVPMAEGTPVYPRPANLFAPKHQGNPDTWWVGRENFARANPDQQPEAMANCHLSADLSMQWKPERRHRLRTAMNQGKAATGQLFGTEAIEPPPGGYVTEVDATNAGLSKDDWNALCAAFDRPLALGKGRRSGYGGTYWHQTSDAAPYPTGSIPVSETVLIRALSDLMILDQWGQLTIPPAPSVFGLGDDWKFDPVGSAIATRRFAPWDRTLGGRGSEICVVEAGSALAYRGGAATELTPAPIGQGRERGFGRWTVMPVGEVKPDCPKATPSSTSVAFNDASLVKIVEAMARNRDTSARDEWIDSLSTTAVEARFRKGPSRSQWGIVESAVRATNDAAGLFAALGKDSPDRKPLDDTSWTKELRDWLFTEITKMSDWPAAHRRFALSRLIRKARDLAPRGQRGD